MEDRGRRRRARAHVNSREFDFQMAKCARVKVGVLHELYDPTDVVPTAGDEKKENKVADRRTFHSFRRMGRK